MARTVHHLLDELAQRALGLTRYRLLRLGIEHLDAASGVGPVQHEVRFLTAEECRGYAADAPLQMPAAFLEAALAKGDRCCAVFVDGGLANYGWCARTPTIVCDGLTIAFDPRQVYFYKAYTVPEYRGLRLHARNRTYALRQLAAEGCEAAITLVEAANDDSLKSVHRLGYREAGRIIAWRPMRRWWLWHDRSCRAHGVALHPA